MELEELGGGLGGSTGVGRGFRPLGWWRGWGLCGGRVGKVPPGLAGALQLGWPCGLPCGARFTGLAPNSLRLRSGQTGGAKSDVEVRFAHAPQTSAPRRPKSPRPSQPRRAFVGGDVFPASRAGQFSPRQDSVSAGIICHAILARGRVPILVVGI